MLTGTLVGAAACAAPVRPAWKKGYGGYCFKATCDVLDGAGCEVGRVVGYDRYVTIQDATESACSLVAGQMDNARCTPAQLTMLSEHRKECAGHVFFVQDGTTRRLV